MICSNCRHANPQGSVFCEACKTPLLAAASLPAQNDSPFGDFLPAWLSPTPKQPVMPRPTVPLPEAAPADPAHPPTGKTGQLNSVLIDSLLKNAPAPAWNSPPIPAPAQNNNAAPPVQAVTRPGPAADPTASLPLPTFQEPPLWYKPPVEPAWQEVKSRPSPDMPSASSQSFKSKLSGPETRETEPVVETGPDYGVERGFYFFTDHLGEVNLYALAGFGRRFGGALIDAVLTAVLGTLFFFIVASRILHENVTPQNIALTWIALTTVFSFLYHTILVGMTSQTLGHRLLGIKVLRRGGRAVGIISGTIRTLYGTIPSLIITIISLFVSPKTTTDNYILGGINLLIYGLVAFGMAWALFDPHHQGIHDKLADTYVVSATRS